VSELVKSFGAGTRTKRVRLPLREHRERAGVTLETIACETRISRRFLEAIEAGEYRQLPGGLFSTSYIRQYAAMTGYDADEILHDLKQSEPVAVAEPVERVAAAGAGLGDSPTFRWLRSISQG